MDERPQSVDPVRQKSGILVVRRHEEPVSLKRPEIFS